ncbi:hypothetical protein ACJ41O_008473 [Fusarium nematophilum]
MSRPELPRHRSRRRSSERGISGPDKLAQLSRPYLLEWSDQTCRQRGILDAEDLREEMASVERPGWRRMVVMKAECDVGVVLAMEMDKTRKKGWAWEFPEPERKRKRRKRRSSDEGEGGKAKGGEEEEDDSAEDEGIRICRASLVIKNRLPILLLDGLPPQIAPRPSRARPPSIARPETISFNKHPPKRSSLEDFLWQSLVDTRPIEDLLGELVHDAWLETLDSLPPLGSDSVDVQWTIARAIEANADTTRCMERRGEFSTVTSADWLSLSERVQRRTQLSVTVALNVRSQQAQEDDAKDSNARNLDRIAYLGGLLLPLTVVSGILSIEGTYGPEGSAFWVFWLAAGLSSIVAVLVIYADHLRTLDVWMEVELAAGEVLEGLDLDNIHHHGGGGGGSASSASGSRYSSRYSSYSRQPHRRQYQTSGGDPERGEARLTTASDGGVYVVQHRGDGTRGRAWRKAELGWFGAVKKMSGWYRWRGSPGMEFRMPGWEERVKGLIWS